MISLVDWTVTLCSRTFAIIWHWSWVLTWKVCRYFKNWPHFQKQHCKITSRQLSKSQRLFSSNISLFAYPAPCWASGFSTACWGGGGGGVWTPPPWSRLLVAVEKNERQRSKAREKSFRNHFGHFLAQVKIGVSRGQNSKIFQNGFSTIKSLILKIEQRIWYHCVCLVKARRTIYKMSLKGQGQSLTSGQVRPRSRDDRNGS